MTDLNELIRDVYAVQESLGGVFTRLLDLRGTMPYNGEAWKELTKIIDMMIDIMHGGDRHEAV